MSLEVDLGNMGLNELLMRSTRSGTQGGGDGLNCSLSSGLGGGGRRVAGLSERSSGTGNSRAGPLSSIVGGGAFNSPSKH